VANVLWDVETHYFVYVGFILVLVAWWFSSVTSSYPQLLLIDNICLILSTLPLLPTLSNPQPLAVNPQNSNLPVFPPLPLLSELTPEENSLPLLSPLRTCSKLLLSSILIETPLPIHKDDPSTSSQIPVPKPTPAATNIFTVEDTSISLNLDASDGEYRCFND